MYFPDFVKVAVHTHPLKIPPYAFKTNTNETKYLTDASVLDVLSKKLSFQYEVLEPPDGQYGTVLENGTSTGLIGMLQREEADIAVAKLSYIEKRAEIVDYSNPYYYISISFITDKPTYSRGDRYALLHPFSSDMWMAVGLSAMIMFFFFSLFNFRKYSVKKMLFHVFGTLLENSTNLKFETLSSKFMTTSWILGAMCISYAYKAVLLSFLTSPSLTGIRDIAEFSKASEKSSFKCSTYVANENYVEMLNSGPEPWKKINQCLIRSKMYTNDITGFLLPETYKKAFIGEQFHLKAFQRAYYISNDKFKTDFYCVAVKKSFCCKNALNKAINAVTAVGLLDKIQREEEFFKTLTKNDLEIKEESKYRELFLEDLSGAFIIFISGCTLASVVLMIEIMLSRMSRRHLSV